MKRNGFAGILIILVIMVLGIVGYFVYKNPQLKLPVSVVLSPSPSTSPSTTASWKVYQDKVGKYEISYPDSWSFKKSDQNLYKGHSLFQNLDSSEQIFGEIKIVTTESLRGIKWSNLLMENFFDPKSDFWVIGENIGGGPGTTFETPSKIAVAGYSAMFQSTHPSTSGYEWSSTNQITNNYYLPIDNSTKELIQITFTYDKSLKGADQVLKTIDQILSTFKFTK